MTGTRGDARPAKSLAHFIAKPAGVIGLVSIVLLLTSLIVGVDTVPGFLIVLPVVAAIIVCSVATVPSVAFAFASFLLGFEIRTHNVGPFQLIRDDRLALKTVDAWREIAQYEFIVPAHEQSHPRLRVFIYLLAGCAASTLSLLISSLALAIVAAGDDRNIGVVCSLSGLMIAASLWMLVIGIQTLASLFWLIRGRAHQQPPVMGLEIRWFDTEHVRPRNWDLELLTSSRWPTGPNTTLTSWLHAYYCELDRGNPVRALSYIDRVVATISPAPWFGAEPRLMPEIACAQARLRENPALARVWLGRAHFDSQNLHVMLRAEAAILLAEGSHAAARDKATEALLLVDELSPPGIAQAERGWLGEIIAEAEVGALDEED